MLKHLLDRFGCKGNANGRRRESRNGRIVRAETFPHCPCLALQPFQVAEKHSKSALEPVSQLFDETQKQGGLQDDGKKEPEYRSEKVGQVVDVVTAAPRRI